MIQVLSQQLAQHNLRVHVLSSTVLRITHDGSETEADVSLNALNKRLSLCEERSHARIIEAFGSRIVAAFGFHQPLRIEDIFPRILPLTQDKSLSAPWTYSIADGALQGALVQDQGVNLRLLPPLELIQIGYSISDIKQSAITNLTTLPVHIQWESIGAGRAAHCGDGFMAARALILEQWVSESCWLGLPSRDELWVWNEPPTEECIMMLIHCAQRAPYAISEQFWLWTPENGIQPWYT